MAPSLPEVPAPPASHAAQEPDRCDHCGALEAYPIAGRVLCADCQIEAGSSCGGAPRPQTPPTC